MTDVFTVDERTRLEQRMRELVAEYLRESDPKSWPTLDGIAQQQQRFWQKKHRGQLLAEITALQAVLRNAPRQRPIADDSDGARLIREAKAKAAELRKQAGLPAEAAQ